MSAAKKRLWSVPLSTMYSREFGIIAKLQRQMDRQQSVVDGRAEAKVIDVRAYVVPKRFVKAHKRTIIVKVPTRKR